jgi:hypothetical protein
MHHPRSIGLQVNIRNLTSHAGSVPYYFRLPFDKKLNIDEMEIPEYSFFNSNYDMKEDAKGMSGVIRPDPPVSAAASAVSQPIEIELLPDFRPLRSSPCKK